MSIKKKLSYGIAICFLLFYFLFFFFDISFSFFNFLFYGLLFLIFILLFRDKKLIRNYHKEFSQTVFIISIIYFIIYYILGVIIGYSYNVYSTSFIGILRNIVVIVVPLLFREEVRSRFLFLNKKKFGIFFITLLFIVLELFSSTFFTYSNNEELFINFFSIFLPIVLENILLTYLAFIGIRSTVYAYFIPMLISRYFIPITLDVDWFFALLFQLILVVVIFYVSFNEYLWKEKRIYSYKTNKTNSVIYLFGVVLIVSFGLFVAGVFKYRPVAILTYSMEPIFTRGDAVIVEKLDDEEKNKLKKGDIIQYQVDKTVVVHRIVKVKKEDNKKVYILKGDNNNAKDPKPVYMEQIMGKVLFSIPKVGYPSVWLSEFLHSDQDVSVEVGR